MNKVNGDFSISFAINNEESTDTFVLVDIIQLLRLLLNISIIFLIWICEYAFNEEYSSSIDLHSYFSNISFELDLKT